MKKSWFRFIGPGLAVLALGACAGPGAMTEVHLTLDGRHATYVLHDQKVPNWAVSRKKLAINYIVRGRVVTAKQRAAVSKVEVTCRSVTKIVRPNPSVDVFLNALPYAGAGGAGVGEGSQAFPGAIFWQYAKYGFVAGLFAGAANGIVQLGGETYTFDNCAAETFRVFPSLGIHALTGSP